ncbi:MAG: RNA-binding protein [Candidatus Nitrosotenuis sp.]
MLKNAKTSLAKISKVLEKTFDDRELLLKNTRQIVNLCSEAIIECHRNNEKVAAKKTVEAQRLLQKYKKQTDPDLHRYLVTPEQEFVEASALLAIIGGKAVPAAEHLKVSEEAYVLGLLDCIGELRRNIYDKIRIGNAQEAQKIFSVMEEMYLMLYPFAHFDKVVKEARKKLDVARILVEETRIAITEEIRRSELIKSMNKK